MQNFRLISLVVSEIDAFKQTYQVRFCAFFCERMIFSEISSAVWIQYTNVTDRQTDGRTPADSKDRAYTERRAVKIIVLEEIQKGKTENLKFISLIIQNLQPSEISEKSCACRKMHKTASGVGLF